VADDSAPIGARGGSRRAVRYVRLTGGWALLAVGVGLLPLPAPGAAFLLLGLAVLGREVAWARRVRERILNALGRRRGRLPLGAPVPVREVRGP
jgi:hypothetical protein